MHWILYGFILYFAICILVMIYATITKDIGIDSKGCFIRLVFVFVMPLVLLCTVIVDKYNEFRRWK